MNTAIETFSTEDYSKIRRVWLAYIKQENHVRPEYFLFYALVKGKSPYKVFSPLINPHKLEIALREHGAGPWRALTNALYALQRSFMSPSPAPFELTGSMTNRVYNPETRKFTFDQTNHLIDLSNEQVVFLLAKVNEILADLKTKV